MRPIECSRNLCSTRNPSLPSSTLKVGPAADPGPALAEPAVLSGGMWPPAVALSPLLAELNGPQSATSPHHKHPCAPGCYGVDREGRPVYVQQPGNIDLEQLFKFTTEERCVRYHVQVLPDVCVGAGRRRCLHGFHARCWRAEGVAPGSDSMSEEGSRRLAARPQDPRGPLLPPARSNRSGTSA